MEETKKRRRTRAKAKSISSWRVSLRWKTPLVCTSVWCVCNLCTYSPDSITSGRGTHIPVYTWCFNPSFATL